MNETLQSARELIGKGYPVTLLREKRHAFKNPRAMSIVDVRFWVTRRAELCLGLHLKGSGLVALDLDSAEAVREAELLGWVSALASETKRGIQFVFRHRLSDPRNRIGFRPEMDLIVNNAVPVYPSVVGGKQRRWLGPVPAAEALPLLPDGLYPEPIRRPTLPARQGRPDDFVRALRYVSSDRTPGAVSGQGRHNRTYWLGNRLLMLFPSLTFEQLLNCLEEFSEKCDPKWSACELLHKATDCWRKHHPT